MKKHSRYESGQAIVIIALAIFGLFGLVALAMDGGHAFSDRRQAQNAADAAALAVAMNYAHNSATQNSTPSNMYSILWPVALASTTSNSYDNDGTRSVVVLAQPFRNATVAECPNGGIAFQVDIDSTLPTWFGTIVGVSQVHNHVSSTSLGCKPYFDIAYSGNTIVALNKTSCRAMEFSGTSSTAITSTTGQGIFVDSSCTGSNTQNALYAGGSGTVSAPSVSSVGGIYHPDTFVLPSPLTPQTGVPPITRAYSWPKPTDVCPTNTATTSGNAINPGLFPGTNSSWASKTFPPAGISVVNAGIYCLTNDFKMTSGDLTAVGVTIIMVDGGVSIQGGSNKLWAPTSGPTKGLLFYVPSSNTGNDNDISISGNGDSEYHGSIVSPASHVTINGTSGTTGAFQTQVIADTITIGGGGNIQLNYDTDYQYRPPVPAAIQLVK